MDITVELREELKSLIKGGIENEKLFDDILNEIEEISQNKGKWKVINKVKEFISDVDIFEAPKKKELTNKQKEYFKIYNEFYDKNGRYATYKELGDIMGVYPSVAFDVIKKIKQKEYILAE